MTAPAHAPLDSLAQATFPAQWLEIRKTVDRRMDQLLPCDSQERDLVAAAMRECALAPGKRIRPLLLMLAAQDLGCDKAGLVDLACAVEMVHAASLVLDDMPCMDNARLRRGRPTVHLAYGEDVAILSAVALLSRAFGVVVAAPEVSPAQAAQVVAELSHAVGVKGLVKGQLQDLREGNGQRSAEAIATTNELKTGVLFSATLQMAAIVADASPCVRDSLKGFARELGQAFQLLDDLQDCCHDSQALGKDTHKDDGKSTLVAVLGVEHVRSRLRGHLDNADAHLDGTYGRGLAISTFVNGLFTQAMQPDRAPAMA